VCDQTRQWVEEVIVGYNICPFAKKTVVDDTVRYVVSDATNSDDLVSDSWREAALLLDADPEEIATTLVMAPKFAGDIDEYAGMGYWMEDYLEDEDEPIFEQAVRLLPCPGSPNAHAHTRMYTVTHQHMHMNMHCIHTFTRKGPTNLSYGVKHYQAESTFCVPHLVLTLVENQFAVDHCRLSSRVDFRRAGSRGACSPHSLEISSHQRPKNLDIGTGECRNLL